MNLALTDTSFLSHAMVPSQITQPAAELFDQALHSDVTLVATAPGLVEFLSLVRKLRARGSLSETEAERVFASLAGSITVVAMDERTPSRGTPSQRSSGNPIPSMRPATSWPAGSAPSSGWPIAVSPTWLRRPGSMGFATRPNARAPHIPPSCIMPATTPPT